MFDLMRDRIAMCESIGVTWANDFETFGMCDRDRQRQKNETDEELHPGFSHEFILRKT